MSVLYRGSAVPKAAGCDTPAAVGSDQLRNNARARK